jgi:tRNA pseudouridine55 synthase
MFNFYTGEVVLIDKPYTWSSFQAVNKIKYAIKNHASLFVDNIKIKPKVGHAGTLDPLATGLLIICTGKKTKEINSYMGLVKEYTGTFELGSITPCYDLEKPISQIFPTDHISNDLILKTAKDFVGVQQQVPPLFSAIMVNGKRAYELAREGKDVELKSREITIHEFEITKIENQTVAFRICCSKGTYIRSIARDFGLALNSGAHLTSLRRTKIGKFNIVDALTPEKFSEMLN